MSPPLVVAYALAGRVDLDLTTEPLGNDTRRQPGLPQGPLADPGRDPRAARRRPQARGLRQALRQRRHRQPEVGRDQRLHRRHLRLGRELDLRPVAAVLREQGSGASEDIIGARPLGIFGDSVTTDHISPAGAIKADLARPANTSSRTASRRPPFNSFGSRRGNDRVMTRGTFGNVRIKNLMCPGIEGGYTQSLRQRRRPRSRPARDRRRRAAQADLHLRRLHGLSGRKAPRSSSSAARTTAWAAAATGPPRAPACSA